MAALGTEVPGEPWAPGALSPALGPTSRHRQSPQLRLVSAGWFLFQFHRVLQYSRPRPRSPQPFFWMFVDSLLLTEDDRAVASRFLEVRAGPSRDARRAGPPQGRGFQRRVAVRTPEARVSVCRDQRVALRHPAVDPPRWPRRGSPSHCSGHTATRLSITHAHTPCTCTSD